MKIERLSQDRIRIFLTFDDLLERGIQKDDLWREPPKLHDLFREMMEQAYDELGFDASGRPLVVEVIAMPAQGMYVIVTRGNVNENGEGASDDDDLDDVYEMEVTMEESEVVMYAFRDFEDVISAAKGLKASGLSEGGRLYSYNGKWIMALEPADIDASRHQAAIALLAEYGDATSVTYAMLEEYGKVIMPEAAVSELCNYFDM